ncbi:serine hydrolase domain-containing protein [Streptomyces sp. NPDC101118]|uniref:serine hydrolase domain-containing protein n=1 Tax=Streptomyces sp. NPDC101118 TaxID=3366109 RepID=UPI00380FCA87
MRYWGKRLRRTWLAATAAGLLAVPAVTATAGSASAQAATGLPPSASAFALPGDSSSDVPDSDFTTLTPEVMRQLDAEIRRVMREASVPGVIVHVSAPGKGTYVKTFGVADKSTGQPMTPNLYMRIGSETKTFTVTAMLELVDQKKIGLDDPISKYIDDVPNGDKITLRNLAGMRSGLYNYSLDPDFQKAFFGNPDRPFTPQELLDYSFKHPVSFQPGAQFDYCNTNLILLGLVVEKITGRPLDEVIEKDVAERAGLDRTSFPTNAAFPSPHAQGYTNQTLSGKVENSTEWNPSWGWAAGAMISTLDDLTRWARVVATGTLLTPATQAQRLQAPPTTIPGAYYGLGIFNVQGWIGHNGSLPGYESLTIYLPGPDATIVVLINTDITYQGQEPTTLFGQAITQVVSPKHVYFLPAANQAPSTSTPSPSGS